MLCADHDIVQLKAISLSKNVVKSIEAQSDLPPFDLYPRAHRVTYKYYTGVLAFLQEDYAKVSHPTDEAGHMLTYFRQRRISRRHGIRAMLGHRRTNREQTPMSALVGS